MSKKLLITGGSGLVGRAINAIKDKYIKHDIEFIFSSSSECDLTNYQQTDNYFNKIRPDYVIHLAANVGGLFKNMNNKVKMLEKNVLINYNVLNCCHKYNVSKVISCLSTCIFPDKIEYPIKEDDLHKGPPHSSNDAYSYAKRLLDIHSKAYSCMFAKFSSKYSIYELQCPLFVPIIEEGWSDSPVAKQIATIYLHDFTNKNIDTLILGCTHYPIMANTIKSVLSKNIQLVHSGETVGYKLLNYLKKTGNDNSYSSNKKIKYFVTDLPQKFDELGSRFLGKQLIDVQHIYL